jgi:3-oxoacyl-[acyl-carrier-protein] synthase II
MKAQICGIGYVTAAGFGAGLRAKTNLLCPGEVRVPPRKDIFSGVDRRYGRLDSFSRLGLAALALCLRDAAVEEWEEKRPIGIVAASKYGCVNTDLDYLDTMFPEGGRFASPNLFAYTLPNCFLGEAALRFGLSGTTLVLNHHDPTGLALLEYAVQELHWNDHQGMLAGICDLEAPAGFASGTDSCGSVFLLLQREAPQVYGCLEYTATGFELDGTPVNDLATLLHVCAGSAGKR